MIRLFDFQGCHNNARLAVWPRHYIASALAALVLSLIMAVALVPAGLHQQATSYFAQARV